MENPILAEQTILVVDDEPQALRSVELLLQSRGPHHVLKCGDSRQVMPLFMRHKISLLLLDISMPHIGGKEILADISQEFPKIPVIMMTGNQDVSNVVECIHMGAFDYITKPFHSNRLLTSVKRALEYASIKEENARLKRCFFSQELEHPEHFDAIITQNRSMISVFRYIEAIANSPLPILITGETGSGKELFAQAIHKASLRPGKMISITVSGLDDQMLYNTLFGHVKGAFTGADKHRPGLVEKALNGTLFLDEIGDLSPNTQIKLLRLLQENQYYPLGSDQPKKANTHFIAATHRNLPDKVKQNVFRQDLFYRLQNHHIKVPSLRERTDDIPFLLSFFIEQAAENLGKKPPTYPPELLNLLKAHSFPGNVRELKGMIYDAVSNHQKGVLSMRQFKEKLLQNAGNPELNQSDSTKEELRFPRCLPTLRDTTLKLLNEAMKRAGGNQSQAAVMLGITRQALNRRLNRK